MSGFIGGELGSPVGFELTPSPDRSTGGDVGRDDERRVVPLQEGTGGGDLVVAQRCAVAVVGPDLLGNRSR